MGNKKELIEEQEEAQGGAVKTVFNFLIIIFVGIVAMFFLEKLGKINLFK